MSAAAAAWVALCVAATAALVAAEWRGARRLAAFAKPVASAAFLGLALACGAAGNGYGRWILAGLVCGAAGDVLLLSPGAGRAFLAGLASFLLGHLLYAVAFALRAPDPRAGALALLAVVPFAAASWRWLRPHAPPEMRGPVAAYVGVISAMEVLGIAAGVGSGDWRIAVGATAFLVSDLAVARERFVAQTPWNPTWGLPLYYGAQLLLAATVAGR